MGSAYVRRKQWEARLLAVAVVNALGESMSGKGGEQVSLTTLEQISSARG